MVEDSLNVFVDGFLAVKIHGMDLWYLMHAAEELQHEHADGPYVDGQAMSNFGGVAFTERKSAVGLLERTGGELTELDKMWSRRETSSFLG